MAKSVAAIKDMLKREEKALEKLQAALLLIAHKETKAEVRGAIKNKRADIKLYKRIIKDSEKCPAVKKPAAKKATAKKAASSMSRCGTKKC